MGVDWNNIETWKRLVAAMYASGPKPNLKEVATYFGSTYDTLENRMRTVKKDADKLKLENGGVSSGDRSTPSKTPTKAATATQRKLKPTKNSLNTVASGRVTKAKPTKKTVVKQENEEDNDSSGAIDSAGMDIDEATNQADGGMNIGLLENPYGSGEALFE